MSELERTVGLKTKDQGRPRPRAEGRSRWRARTQIRPIARQAAPDQDSPVNERNVRAHHLERAESRHDDWRLVRGSCRGRRRRCGRGRVQHDGDARALVGRVPRASGDHADGVARPRRRSPNCSTPSIGSSDPHASIRHLNGGTHVGTTRRSSQMSEGSHAEIASSLAPSTLDRGAPRSHPHADRSRQRHWRPGLTRRMPRSLLLRAPCCSMGKIVAIPSVPREQTLTQHRRQRVAGVHDARMLSQNSRGSSGIL